MNFTKMHGIGNDFIVVDAFHQTLEAPEALARALCRRRFGVGADGLILALPSRRCDARMRIFNSDGSEPEMCGNGVRCLGKFLYEQGLVRKETMTVETLGGDKVLRLSLSGEHVTAVTVDMGVPCLTPAAIPVAGRSNRLTLHGLDFFCVSMGNPHAVTFDLYPGDEDFRRLGPLLEQDEHFPRRANIEFCRIDPQGWVDVRVWERGDGETLACGTGACAVVAAGVSLGLLPRETTVRLPGGKLEIKWQDDGHILMTGPAENAFNGKI